MENAVQKVQEMENVVGPSMPPPKNEVQDSNDDETTIETNSALTFGLDENNVDEVQQPLPSDDFIMFLDDEETSGSLHSTSKPKQRKKKKLVVSRKEFLNLQSKFDQILAAVTSKTPLNTDVPIPQTLIDRVEVLETRETLTAEITILHIEMGIRQ